jgi:hypothetical protein
MLSLLELPLELQALLKLGIEIAVVFVLTQAAKYLPFDVSGYKAQIVAALFSAAMVMINGFLAQVPAGLESLVVALLNLVVILLGSFGLYKVYRKVYPK